jgi:hypothetical protein
MSALRNEKLVSGAISGATVSGKRGIDRIVAR